MMSDEEEENTFPTYFSRLMSLKDIVLSYLVDRMCVVSQRNRHDVEYIKEIANYLHALPVGLLDDFNKMLVDQKDLDNYHIALMTYPLMSVLNLDECMDTNVDFDLDFVVRCSKENMQHLTEVHFPVGSVAKGLAFNAFCQAVPNIRKIVLYGCEINEQTLISLSSLCPSLEHLNLRNTPLTSERFRLLCCDDAVFRSSLKVLDVRGTMLGENDVKACLRMFSSLAEFDTDHCLLECLFQMHGKDVFHGSNASSAPEYNLTEIRCTFYRGVNVDAIQLGTVICPKVHSVDLNFFSHFWTSDKTFQSFANFVNLRDLSLSFKLPMNNIVTIDMLAAMLRSLAPQLEYLRLVRVGENAIKDVSPPVWDFNFCHLQMLLLYGIPDHPFSQSTLKCFFNSCLQMRILICYFITHGDELIDILENAQLSKTLNEITLKYSLVSLGGLKKLLKFANLKILTLYSCLSALENEVVENIVVPDDIVLTIS